MIRPTRAVLAMSVNNCIEVATLALLKKAGALPWFAVMVLAHPPAHYGIHRMRSSPAPSGEIPFDPFLFSPL